jgi:hypothetical protein
MCCLLADEMVRLIIKIALPGLEVWWITLDCQEEIVVRFVRVFGQPV